MNGNSHDAGPEAHDGRVGAVSNTTRSGDDIESTAQRIIESVPVELKAEARKLVTLATGFTGPTPPPAVLEEYERLVQGSAKRFLDDYFEQKSAEAEHRRGLQAKQLEYSREAQKMVLDARRQEIELEVNVRKRGQWFALTIALVLASAGFYALYLGHPGTAAAIVVTGIASSITAMLMGHFKRKQKSQEALDEP
ncbi:MAG TPA: DUF2335 domain-containing protein [Oligoflexus sp.]|uniref:DUF2335 domain-containing protein n=1 Tax=Oligoflexus sp. TaxID=1971216 RepID=UPI002D27D265|nr:DUF2335 domain-containing protein [Oligoflexus sp.]HYX37827.1 DUF2335 domain-containing protein [Oligoflexus sp.]